MDIFLRYLQVFLVGGIVCFIGQILINKTKMTSARILVLFLTLGVVLEAVGAFRYIKEFGSSGITVPIIGFGKFGKRCYRGSKVWYNSSSARRITKSCGRTNCGNRVWLYILSNIQVKNQTNVKYN